MGLKRFAETTVSAQDYRNETTGYGPLKEDPDGVLDLPAGFSYRILSRTGDLMSDGLKTPGKPDGMAAFPGPDGAVALVRNHELSSSQALEGPFGSELDASSDHDLSRWYDARDGRRPHVGGTSNVIYDPETGTIVKSFLSLAGTCRNCAGGPTPWGTWITCEETLERAGDGNLQDHGYNFEVPATAEVGIAEPIPLKAMGRFNHEAVAVLPGKGIVYQTEDRGDGLVYRFLPKTPGKLTEGGRLQAMVLRVAGAADTRNWPAEARQAEADHLPSGVRVAESTPMAIGREFSVDWIDMDEVESPNDDLRYRGRNQGAAVFARGEGMWYDGEGSIYFACTNGGSKLAGQVFKYTPSAAEGEAGEKDEPGQLSLYVESPDRELLEYCDNLTVAPWGDLVLAEDGARDQYLRGVTPEGKLFTLAKNRLNFSELTGPCFDPAGKTLFVNIQTPGITLAIQGPWQDRA